MFFLYLIFLSFVSFSVVILVYGVLVRFLGSESRISRYAQLIVVPLAVIGYDFLTIVTRSYWVGSIPIGLVILLLGYYYLFKHQNRQLTQTVPNKKNKRK